jgi:integrase
MNWKDVDINKQSLHLQPFSNVVKNKKEREVVIHQNLLNYFDAMQLKNYPGDYFIFSQSFQPGQKKIHRQIATQLWNKLVMQQLGIAKYLYSLKHLGATDYIKAGAGEDNIVDHLGHSSKIITRMYTQEGIKQSRDVISKTKIEF